MMGLSLEQIAKIIEFHLFFWTFGSSIYVHVATFIVTLAMSEYDRFWVQMVVVSRSDGSVHIWHGDTALAVCQMERGRPIAGYAQGC